MSILLRKYSNYQNIIRDGDGFLSKEEFSQASDRITQKQVSSSLTEYCNRGEKVEAVYKRNDQDGDGKLSREEYNLMVNKRNWL